MEYTTKWKLSKPAYDDDVDIQVLNNNFDIIDGKLQTVSVSDNTLHVDDKSYPLDYMPIAGGNFTGDITVLTKPVVSIEETITSTDGYCIKYSNGYMEQHYAFKPTTASFATLNFLTPFKDTNYCISTCGEKQDIGEYGSFVDYVGETLGATQPDKVQTTTSVTLSYHYAWAFGTVGKQKIMVNIWGRWK